MFFENTHLSFGKKLNYIIVVIPVDFWKDENFLYFPLSPKTILNLFLNCDSFQLVSGCQSFDERVSSKIIQISKILTQFDE